MQEFLEHHAILLFYFTGVVGMLAHYTKKWARGEYLGNLWAYLFADNPRASIAAAVTHLGAVAAVVASGDITTLDVTTLAALGFLTGYTVDSAVNNQAPRLGSQK